MSLEASLAARHTVREFQPHPLTPDEIGQLLWSAQGVTHEVWRSVRRDRLGQIDPVACREQICQLGLEGDDRGWGDLVGTSSDPHDLKVLIHTGFR